MINNTFDALWRVDIGSRNRAVDVDICDDRPTIVDGGAARTSDHARLSVRYIVSVVRRGHSEFQMDTTRARSASGVSASTDHVCVGVCWCVSD